MPEHEDQPTEETLQIDAAVAAAEMLGMHINDFAAGRIAAQFHSGQASHLYSLASTGNINVPAGGAKISFGENFDDNVLVKIDGVQVLRDTSWNTPTLPGVVWTTKARLTASIAAVLAASEAGKPAARLVR